MRCRNGMTLVELLVVLVILASLAVTVSVSSSGMLDRAHVESTRRQGESMRAAFEAHDGLSIVSDLGLGYLRGLQNSITNAADGTDTALLRLLFDYRHPLEVTLPTEGYDPVLSAVVKEVAGFQSISTTNGYWEIVYNAVTNVGAKTQVLAKFDKNPVVFVGGWRGPYCDARVLDGDGQLRDGFGGTWRLGTNATSRSSFAFSLASLGRDRSEGGADWPDADIEFDVTLPSTTLSVEGTVGEGVELVSFYAFCFEPNVELTYSNVVEERVVLRCVAKSALVPVCVFDETDVTSEMSITPGLRLVSAVGVTKDDKVYHAAPRAVMIRPGGNSVKLSLKME